MVSTIREEFSLMYVRVEDPLIPEVSLKDERVEPASPPLFGTVNSPKKKNKSIYK